MRVERKTKVLDGLQLERVDFDALIQQGEPVILKGMLEASPLIAAAKTSDQQAMSHLQSHYNERPLLYYTCGANAKGRFFYNSKMDGLNFTTERFSLSELFERLENEKKTKSGTAFYVGSAELIDYFPKLLGEDGLRQMAAPFKDHSPRVGIWLGNRTTAATHFDVSNNVAVCMVGRRRFTLFPPDQIENLYPGPLEPTPGGPVVSMVDLNAPDFVQYPKAKDAFQQGQIAELEPGDILVYPAMWWHQVEALEDFNVLINYWWDVVPSFVDDPMNTLLHGLLSLRDRPDDEKKAWRNFFDYYVFGDAGKAGAHLPDHIRGPLAPIDDVTARRLRARLLQKFNR